MLVPTGHCWVPQGPQPLGQPPWECSSTFLSLAGPWSLLPVTLQPVAHQGDEVGEGELQAHVDHVRIPLSRPQVGVVAVHQVGQQTLLLVPALGS